MRHHASRTPGWETIAEASLTRDPGRPVPLFPGDFGAYADQAPQPCPDLSYSPVRMPPAETRHPY